MTPRERLYRAFCGQAVDHVPFVPKIWVDLGAALTNTALRVVIENPLLADTGLDCIAPLDPMGGFSVADARRAVGDNVILMGGLDTLSFIHSTEAQIAAEARRCLREGTVGRRCFILGSGCVVPRGTNKEILKAVSAVVRNFEPASNCCWPLPQIIYAAMVVSVL